MKTFIKSVLCLVLLTIISCTLNSEIKVENTTTKHLISWNDGKTKTAIIEYVEDVTNPESKNFIPVIDRIATFDNDGNLWSEQPAYFQLYFAIDRVKAMASEHPEWNEEQPFKAILEGDMEELVKHGEHGLLQIVMATHGGITTDEFEADVKQWLATAKHPRFNKPYNALVYQPMLELLDYLRANDFKTFIVSPHVLIGRCKTIKWRCDMGKFYSP